MYKRYAHRVILETLKNSQPEPAKEGEGGEEQETIGGGEKQMLMIVRIVHQVLPTPQSSSSSSSNTMITILNTVDQPICLNFLSLSALNIRTHNSNGYQPGKGG